MKPVQYACRMAILDVARGDGCGYSSARSKAVGTVAQIAIFARSPGAAECRRLRPSSRGFSLVDEHDDEGQKHGSHARNNERRVTS